MKDNIRLLLIDDDADDRDLFIKAVNEIDAQIGCTAARNGRQALDLVQDTGVPLPDIIFLDLRMPRFSGRRCLAELKQNDRLKHIPVVVYTTSREVEDSKELRDMGAVHFISKPNNPEEIYFLISFVLEEQANNLYK